jgi:hypothetical protein
LSSNSLAVLAVQEAMTESTVFENRNETPAFV